MQVENDYDKDVYNGDLGVVSRIDTEEGELMVEFDGREVTYGFGELDELVLAYATTIHKSQGSEYPAVVCHGERRRRTGHSTCARPTGFAVDSLLEGDGFERLVPRHEKPAL
jgi:hypothetical protein